MLNINLMQIPPFVIFNQLINERRLRKRCTSLMIDEHVFRDALIQTCISQPQAEIKIFKVTHAKSGIKAVQSSPSIMPDGNAEKIAPIGWQ